MEELVGVSCPLFGRPATRSEWPDVLDAELDDLTATRPNIDVVRLPMTHLGPLTDGLDETVARINRFLTTTA